MELIDNAKWRYATKKFDASKSVSNENIELLKEAISLAPTSYGLQAYKVLIVTNQELKDKMSEAAWGQTQVKDASHVFVFAGYNKVNNDHIDDYINLKADASGIDTEQLKGYGDFMKNTIGSMPEEAHPVWNTKQTYIALGNLMNAAAELKIDTCPMEGFAADKIDEILGLSEMGLHASVICPVGYRHEEDQAQHSPKVRKSHNDLFVELA